MRYVDSACGFKTVLLGGRFRLTEFVARWDVDPCSSLSSEVVPGKVKLLPSPSPAPQILSLYYTTQNTVHDQPQEPRSIVSTILLYQSTVILPFSKLIRTQKLATMPSQKALTVTAFVHPLPPTLTANGLRNYLHHSREGSNSLSCHTCRSKKVRCSGSVPCQYCSKRALPCSVSPRGPRRAYSVKYDPELLP